MVAEELLFSFFAPSAELSVSHHTKKVTGMKRKIRIESLTYRVKRSHLNHVKRMSISQVVIRHTYSSHNSYHTIIYVMTVIKLYPNLT